MAEFDRLGEGIAWIDLSFVERIERRAGRLK